LLVDIGMSGATNVSPTVNQRSAERRILRPKRS
jgi:hypothetical protein